MTKDQIVVFMSYKTSDKRIYNIDKVAKLLMRNPKIKEVLYWEKDVDGDIIDYMNFNLERCDILLLFCSEGAKYSYPVDLEWKSALAQQKPIIPLFTNIKNIPPLLLSMKGVEYTPEDLNVFVQEIYKNIIERLTRKLLPKEVIRILANQRNSENLILLYNLIAQYPNLDTRELKNKLPDYIEINIRTLVNYLKKLVKLGLISESIIKSSSPGRPRKAYST